MLDASDLALIWSCSVADSDVLQSCHSQVCIGVQPADGHEDSFGVFTCICMNVCLLSSTHSKHSGVCTY